MKREKWFLFRFILLPVLFCLVMVGCKPKDSDIQNDLNTAMSAYPGVTTTVNDGVATLSGQVDNESTRSNAEADAKKVKGVKSVENNITVTPPPPPVVISSDDSLKNAVNAAISGEYSDVKATVNDGVVTLTGTIKRSELPKLMQKVNEMHPKKVENQLTIK